MQTNVTLECSNCKAKMENVGSPLSVSCPSCGSSSFRVFLPDGAKAVFSCPSQDGTSVEVSNNQSVEFSCCPVCRSKLRNIEVSSEAPVVQEETVQEESVVAEPVMEPFSVKEEPKKDVVDWENPFPVRRRRK